MTDATQNTNGETRSQWRDVWDQFTKHKGALIGGILFFGIVFAVMIGPWSRWLPRCRCCGCHRSKCSVKRVAKIAKSPR